MNRAASRLHRCSASVSLLGESKF